MKKRRIIIFIGVMIFGLLGWMGYSSIQSLKEKRGREVLTNSLSEMFESLKIDAEIPEGRTFLMYFNSECQHCQWEIEQLSKHIDQFTGTNIALVSLEPTDSAFQFLQEYALQSYFMETDPEYIMSTFNGGVPQIFIYEKNELKEKFRGEVKMEVLLEALKK